MESEPNHDKLRVAIVEDVADTRSSLVYLINATSDMVCVDAVASGEAALQRFPACDPQVVLLDIELAGELSGVDCIEKLGAALPWAKVVMLTGTQDAQTVAACLARGAVGYLLKTQPPTRLPQSLRDAAEGGSPMSPEIARYVRGFFQSLAPAQFKWEKLSSREQEILELLIAGFAKKEIADRLNISEETVRTHCRHIYEKLHVTCRQRAVGETVPMAVLKLMRPPKPPGKHDK